MSDEKPKVDPAYPSSDGLSAAGEAAMGVLGAAAGLIIPVVGSAATQAILKRAIRLPLEQRRTNWFNGLGEGLRELQDRLDGFDPDALGENDEFVSTVFEVTHMAMKTHREEKLTALRNVVLNTAVGLSIEDATRGTFMTLLERFSVLHIRVLQILDDALSSPEIEAIGGGHAMMPLWDALHLGLGSLADAATINVVVEDIISTRLVRPMGNAAITPDPMTAKCLTPLGDGFVRFIASPLS